MKLQIELQAVQDDDLIRKIQTLDQENRKLTQEIAYLKKKKIGYNYIIHIHVREHIRMNENVKRNFRFENPIKNIGMIKKSWKS